MDRLISEQKAIEAINDYWGEMETPTIDGYINAIKAIPSAEPCEDAISRWSLLDAFGLSEKTRKWGGDHSGYDTMMLYEIQDMIESAPSVKPQEPTGHWIKGAGMWICNQCGYEKTFGIATKFCSQCGAKMVEPQESEDI